MSEDHVFDEYADKIIFYEDIELSIFTRCEHRVRMGMYEMVRNDLITAISLMAGAIKDQLIDRCIKDYQYQCKMLGEEYQTITEKALDVPKTTAELMDSITYVNNVEMIVLRDMEDRLKEVLRCMLFLSDHVMFTPVEMKQNNITFWWYLRMPRTIEEHAEMVEQKILEFQESLNTRIKKFTDDLEMYAKLVDNLQYNGNIDELPKYHKKAKQLDNR